MILTIGLFVASIAARVKAQRELDHLSPSVSGDRRGLSARPFDAATLKCDDTLRSGW